MILINAEDGNVYEYNPDNGLISMNRSIISSVILQPVFTVSGSEELPQFGGILNRRLGKIISLSGKINPIVDSSNIG